MILEYFYFSVLGLEYILLIVNSYFYLSTVGDYFDHLCRCITNVIQ